MIALLCATALAQDWSWQTEPVDADVVLDADAFASFGGASGTDAVEAALEAAIRTWNLAGADVRLTYAGRDDDATYGTDDEQITVSADSVTGTTALTEVQEVVDAGDLVDCDLRLHTANDDGSISWSTEASGAAAGSYDVERAFLRELGRCLGLADGSGGVMDPVLPQGTGPSERLLATADVDALIALYGARTLSFTRFTSAVRYDRDGGDGRGAPGETVLLQANLLNEGDWAAEPVVSLTGLTSDTASFTAFSEDVAGEDTEPGEELSVGFTFDIEDCAPNANPTTAELTVTDATGASTTVELEFFLQCADPNAQTDDPGDGAPGCGCQGGNAGVLLLPLLALGRRRVSRR